MAGFGDLLQRITRSLEEAREQQPGDDLRARLGYGNRDEDELAPDAEWEPETEPESGAARTRRAAWKPETVRSSEASRTPTTATSRTSGAHRASPTVNDFGDKFSSPAPPPRPHASPASVLSEHVRARLGTPEALREAFVVKEILDRPLGRRRRT